MNEENEKAEEMDVYIGVKTIKAIPMSKHSYNEAHGRNIAGDECDGYLVQYQNAKGEFELTGYFSWSPKDVFEEAYRKIDNSSPFVLAAKALKTMLDLTE